MTGRPLDALRSVLRSLWWRPAFWRCMRVTAVLYAIGLFISTHRRGLDLRVNETQSLGDVNLDKPVHALAFGLIMALTVMARLAGRQVAWPRQVTFAAVLVVALATVNELTQQYVGRTTSAGDLLANLLGVGAVALILLWLPGRDEQGHAARLRLSARLVWLAMLPVLVVVTFCPSLPLEVQWPAWWRAIFTHDGGPRQLTTLLSGMAGMTTAWMALGGTRRSSAWALGGMILTGTLALAATTYNPMVQVQDALFWTIGAAAAFIPLILSPSPESLPKSSPPPSEDSLSADPSPAASPAEGSSPADSPSQASQDKPTQDRFVGHARTVSILTLLSRVTGLVRESALAATLGLSPVAAAFVFAFQIPNLFRRLFGEGALAAAIVPVYARQLRQDPALAARFVSLCLALLAITLGALTLLGEMALAMLLVMRDWSPDTALAIRLTMIMLPYMPLVCGVALVGAILQVRGRFASTAAVPILLNLVVITATLAATWQTDSPEALRSSVVWVSWSVIVAGLLQLAWQLAALTRVERLTRHWHGTGPAMKALGAMFVPMALGLAAFQINTFLDAMMALGFSAKQDQTHFELLGHAIRYPLQEAAVAALGWGQRLYEFPLGIFGIAIATAIFPALSHAAAASQHDGKERFNHILRHGLRLSVFIGLPASVGLIVVALPLSRLAYERGQFTLEDSARVAWLLCGYAPAIWAYTMNHVLARAFYAQGDARTPLRVSLAMVGMNLLLNLTLVWSLGAQGFAWATAGGAMLQCAILLRALGRRGGRPVDHLVVTSWLKAVLATGVMTGVLLPLVMYAQIATLSRTASALWLAALVSGGIVTYLMAAMALRCQELGWLVRRRSAA